MIKNVMKFVAVLAILGAYSCRDRAEFPQTQLDANNNVIPAGVNAMEDRYKKKLKPEEYPVIVFDAKSHDFGTIKQGDKVAHVFKFKNTGKNDLYVLEVHPSCGCTAPEWTTTAVKSGQSGQIKIIFNSANKMGHVEKSVALLANTMMGNETLTFTANIIQ